MITILNWKHDLSNATQVETTFNNAAAEMYK